jgi:hypothetical protein
MSVINQALKRQFEQEYSGSTVNLATGGTPAALEALINGEIDLAAVGRPLTQQERSQGLVEVPISREKIAIVVGPDNPFQGNLSFEQFARIFRGEITNWSEIGGQLGPIRFVDRPDLSDTRQSLSNYQVFRVAPFETGANAVQTQQDDTAAIVQELGADGISYAIASQVLDQDNVRVISMHNTLPDDPRYPFSQPRGYVYYQTPSPAVQAFLGYATSTEGQAAVADAKQTEAEAVATGDSLDSTIASGEVEATSPNGSAIARGNADGTVQLFDAQGNPTGEPFQVAAGAVSAIAFNPDGTELVTGSADGVVQKWDLQGTAIGEPFTGHEGAVTAVAFNSDGTSIISSSADNPELISLEGNLVAEEGAIANADNTEGASAGDATNADAAIPVWGWLVPLVLLGLLLGWLFRKRATSGAVAVSPAAPPAPLAPAASVPGAASAVSASPSLAGSGTHSAPVADATAANATPIAGSALTRGAAAVGSSPLSDRPDAIPEYQALYNRGMVLAESGLYEEAIASFDRAIEAKPDFFAAWASKGDALLSVDRPEEAIASFDQAIELSTASTAVLAAGLGGTALAATWAGKGNALANLGRAEEAIASFDQALAIEPTYAEAQASRNALIASLSTATPPSIQAGPSLESFPSLADTDSVLAETPLVESAADTASADAASANPLEETSAEDIPQVRTQIGGAVLAAGTAAWSAMSGDRIQTDKMQSNVEAAKFDVGQTDEVESLAAVDEDLNDLPEGYGESRIVLMPRDPQWAYAYWDIPAEHKEELRQQGGSYLALRLYDVTDIDLNHQNPHSLQQFGCEEMARDWYLPIPVSDRDYLVEIGYTTNSGDWLMLARSASTRIPPIYPSDWFEDQFLTLPWDEDLRGKTFLTLIPPPKQDESTGESTLYNTLFGLAQSAESMRIAGSLFGSMQQVPQQAISSYIFPSGAALWALPTLSGVGMSGIGMSGAGFPASIPPIRPRKFWLVADAELIVYGATEPDATVTIDGQPIQLNPDGTFRFQMSFQDGMIHYPIIAVAVDGEQSRSIHMEFERETPERHTNTKDDATDEWLE